MNIIPQPIADRCFNEYQGEMACIADELDLTPDCPFRHMAQKFRGNFYLSYPYLFTASYPSVKENDVDVLTLAGNLYFAYLLVLDELLDNDTKSSSVLILHALHERAMESLFRLFPPDSPFWDSFKTYRAEFLSVRKYENGIANLASRGEAVDGKNLKLIARNKSAFAKCATAGLQALAGACINADPLAETQDHFHTGLQFLDDLEDWKEDYLKHRPSYLLSTVFSDPQLRQALDSRPADEIGVLGRYVYYSDTAQRMLGYAKASFVDSLRCSERHNVPLWKKLVEEYILKVDRLEKDFYETKEWLLEKRAAVERIHRNRSDYQSSLHESLSTVPLAGVFADAVEYLLIERQNGYLEMSHRMTLPDLLNKSAGKPSVNVSGNLFQRTIVLDSFLDVNKLSDATVRADIISEELDVIRNSRMESVRGGWNYFPGYPCLPPDADDLAQVVNLSARTNWAVIKPVLDDSINLLVGSNRYDDGTFRTWILDPADHGQVQEKLHESVATYWGERLGKDIEVTANMAFALNAYDSEKYRRVVSEAADAVGRAQTAEGGWPSVWYCGSFYGTYVASRLLSGTGLRPECLSKTRCFLAGNQLACGGWGGSEGDPMNTAFALLSLCCVKEGGFEIDDSLLERGVAYLGREQKKEGSWRQAPFIKMFIGGKNIIYRSETVTTAFVVKSLAAVVRSGLPLVCGKRNEETGND